MFNPVPATEARHWQDWLVLQDWDGFSSEDHATWDLLYARQMPHLEGHVVQPFRDGLDKLDLGAGGIPELSALSDRLESLTGWRPPRRD